MRSQLFFIHLASCLKGVYTVAAVVLVWLMPLRLSAQTDRRKITISGYVHESESLESLPGVNVFIPALHTGTLSNTYGFYSLSIPSSDSMDLFFSCLGYMQQVLHISSDKDAHIDIQLDLESNLMQEVVVQANEDKVSLSPQMSTIKIPMEQMKNVPGLLGEKDMLKVLQLMPGVQKGREGSSGLYVRGGGPDQNLILLDDAIVYNAFHLFGFYSLFNGDALKSIELTKGGFPARYGGRLSSVVEMNMKDGSKDKIHGEAGIGIISSKLTIEGPLIKNKSSFLFSARRTYLDLLVSPFLPADKRASYYFYDMNAKVNYEFNNNKLYLSSYIGKDQFSVNDQPDNYKGALYWGNITATARWNHLFSQKLFSNTSLVFSRYKLSGTENQGQAPYQSEGNYNSYIRDVTLKTDVDYHPAPRHSVKAGTIVIAHRYNPVATVFVDKNTNDASGNKTNGFESALYMEDIYKPFNFLSVNAGFRLSYYTLSKTQYLNPEPRLSAAFHITRNFSLKTSYAYMNQYVHLLTYTKVGLPTDLWVPATKKVPPQKSQQFAMGLAKDFPDQHLYFTLEGYYKESKNVVTYKNGANYLSVDNDVSSNWENQVTSGKGWAYGLEFLLHKKAGKFSGWLAYTLSWSQVQFELINQGRKYFSTYDRRHDASVVLIYKPSSRLTFSTTWVYGTGNRITLPEGTYPNMDPSGNFDAQNYRTFFTDKNAYKMPAYHRWDIGVQFHKQLKRGMERTIEVSVYNLYNRNNPYFYYIVAIEKQNYITRKLKQVSLFPVLPSIAYRIKF